MFIIKAAIRNVKHTKAAGADGIISEMLKKGDEYLFLWLSELMSMCGMNREVPNDMKKVIIVHI